MRKNSVSEETLQPEPAAARTPWHAPKIAQVIDLAEITQGGTGTGNDAGSPS